jgi:predicted XRE-type DNA-binding protein
MLLGKPWIDRDQVRQKEEAEVLEQKKQELTDFMTKNIA